MELSASDLAAIQEVYERGLYLQAFHAGQAFGPIENWTGPGARVLAGRLAGNIGAPTLARRLFLRAYRETPHDPETRYFYVRTILERHGPLPAWKVLQTIGEMPEAPPELRSEWFALHGLVAGVVRDFDTAERWLDRAEELFPNNPWVLVERSGLLEMADRYPEALFASQHSTELRPWYRPGILSTAHVLQLMGRDREALELLVDADSRLESQAIAIEILGLLTELEEFEESEKRIDRLVELSPLMEKEPEQWLAGVRSDLACQLGNIPAAVELGRQAKSPFYDSVSDNMQAASSDTKRVLLPVGFVRQHHMTCAPATLTTISRHWAMPADHLAMSEEICYDGTPDHGERNWAEQNGWVAKEFRVTWESAIALIDRGVPFTLAIVGPASAHLQAVIGYDARRGTLLVRDPFYRHVGEALASQLFESQQASGPRGMALVPRERAALFDGIDLPESSLYDRHYRIQRSLLKHQREEAQEEYERLAGEAPGHRITLNARRSLAAYDTDVTASLVCIEDLLQQFPDNPNLQLSRLSHFRELGRRDDRLQILEAISKKERSDDSNADDPVFWQQLAQELSEDARQHRRAIRLIVKTLRVRPVDPQSYYTLATILWDQRKFDDALTIFRFAACVDDTDEHLSRAYLAAARKLNQTERALDFLRKRFDRFGTRSAQPARTLFLALEDLDRKADGLELLDKALKLRPEDGDLLLFAADQRGQSGDIARASELVAAASGKTSRAEWLRASARLETAHGRQASALGFWRDVLELEPLAMDAHSSVARLLAETEGPEAVNRHFQEATAKAPYHYNLQQLWSEWLRDDDDPAAQEPVLRRMVEIHPADAWSRRELACSLLRQRRNAEAAEQAETALALDPSGSHSHGVRGEIYAAASDLTDAIDCYRKAISLSVDNGHAISQLVACCNTPVARRDALQFIEKELVRQTTLGDGLLAFTRCAAGTLAPDDLLATLRRAQEERPDLSHAWSALTGKLLDYGKLEEARSNAEAAVKRFPLLPGLLVNLAAVCGAQGDREAQRNALEEALRINPALGSASQQLCALLEQRGEIAAAVEVLEDAIKRNPLDPSNHAALAYTHWKHGDRQKAIDRIKETLKLDAENNWGWSMLHEWSSAVGRPREAADLARELTERRPGELRTWLTLARVLNRPGDLNERLACLDKAITLNPRCFEAYDLRSEIFVEAGRFDEAIAACAPAGIGEIPIQLAGRKAWVEAERGDLRTAIDRMARVVQEDPAYTWGWRQIALWNGRVGAFAEYVHAAERIIRLEPQEGHGFTLLGDARMRQGNRKGAKEAWQQAIHLSPHDEYAAASLFEAQVEDKEWDQARATIDALQGGIDRERILALRIRCDALTKDARSATSNLRELCLSEGDADVLRAAVSSLLESGLQVVAQQTLWDVILDPSARPETADQWVRTCLDRNDLSCESQISKLRTIEAVWARAASAYLEGLAESATRRKRFPQFLKSHRESLRKFDRTWGSVAYALVSTNKHRKAVEWTDDWLGRAKPEPWMLINRHIALRHLGRTEEATRASERALELNPDHCTPLHAVCCALEYALDGNPTGAKELLQQANPTDLKPYYRFLHGIAGAAIEMQNAARGRSAAFVSARHKLGEARQVYKAYRTDRALNRAYRRTVRRIAQDHGGLAAKAWRFYVLLSSWG